MTIINADCLEWMRTQPDNSITTIVTDPPYGLHFMNKGWDKFSKDKLKIGRKEKGTHTNSAAHEAARYDERLNDEFQEFMFEFGREALRIIKPGGHMLMFGAPRRYHRQACGLEDAGWEIRDCLIWIFGSGFPKSHNHFGFEGYGTSLKPAYEPIIMCMKPLEGTFKQNAEKWGVGGINIDACRIPTEQNLGRVTSSDTLYEGGWKKIDVPNPKGGRWPANLILDEQAGEMLDAQSGMSKSTGGDGYKNSIFAGGKKTGGHGLGDKGGASRFFYCAKSSSSERNAGLEGMPLKEKKTLNDYVNPSEGRTASKSGSSMSNHHPTVKPLKLMEYLINLVMPPKDGILLDPFAGSGSTILAAQNLGYQAIGIEKEKEYCDIAEARLKSDTTKK